MRSMVDACAAYERALIAARTSAALQAKRRRGERAGSVPYGYRLADDGVHVVADDAEQQTIAGVQQLAADGLS